jgi:hypothetical protein
MKSAFICLMYPRTGRPKKRPYILVLHAISDGKRKPKRKIKLDLFAQSDIIIECWLQHKQVVGECGVAFTVISDVGAYDRNREA